MHALIALLCVVLFTRFICGQNIKNAKGVNNRDTGSMNVTMSNSSMCKMEVQHFTGIYLEHWIGVLKPDFAHYNLVFANTTVITALSTTIRPLKWVWTYHPPNSINPYLNWPVDFPTLSFGLLCAKCLQKDVFIRINVTPPDCTIALGHQNASLAIAAALNEITQKYLVRFHPSYNYSYWCYLSEIPGVRNTIAYQFALYFNYPVDLFRYKCCNSSFNYYNEKVEVSCPEMMLQKWRESTLGPYIIGLVLLCHCPLILCSWGDTMEANGRNIPAEKQYEDLDKSDKRQWIYLDGHSPISLTNLLCGLCDLGWRHPVAVSRLRRGIFVLFSPILIFLQFLLYSTYQGDITLDLIDHGVPMGFLSMLGGIEKSKKLFVPMLGGPYGLLFMYYITGFIVLLTPRSLENIMQRGSLDSKYAGFSPLTLSTERIEEISMVSVNQYCGYKRLSMLLLARFYLTMMPRFWVEAVHIVCRRMKFHLDLLKKYLPQPIFIISACILVPLNLIFGSLEMCFSLIFYAIPLIWFLLVLIIGFVSSATEFIQTQIHMNMPLSCGRVLRITMYAIIGPFLFYFVYGCFAIYLASFSIVGEIIIFLFYSLVLFPSSSFGYLFFGGALLYYIWKLLKGIGDVYCELLSDLFEICSNRDHDNTMSKLHNSTVMIKAPPGLKITTLRVNDRTITLTEEQTNMMHNSATANVTTYIHYDKHIPGISRRLFIYIVRKSKPVHITVFQAIFRIVLIVLLVVGTLKLSINSQGMSSEISEVMHVLFVVVIGALPRVLEITLAQTDKAVHREIHLRMLDMLVQEFDQSNMELNESCC